MSDLKDQPAAAKSYAVAGFSEWQIRTEAAVKNERARIIAIIREELDHWRSGQRIDAQLHAAFGDADEIEALRQMLRLVANDIMTTGEPQRMAMFSPVGVWVRPDLPLTEQARKFLDTVNAEWGSLIVKPAVDTERQRIIAQIVRKMNAYHEKNPGMDDYDCGCIDAWSDVIEMLAPDYFVQYEPEDEGTPHE